MQINKKTKHIFKVVILGNISVGKTSIIDRIMGREFNIREATVGVECGEFLINDIDSNYEIALQIWDTSGAERYRAITTSHIRNADGALVVYDVSDRESYNSMEYWIETIKKNNNENIVIFLLSNKNDLEKVVEEEEGNDLKVKKGLKEIFHISAKTNENVLEMFREFYKSIYDCNKENINKKHDQYKKLKERKIKAKEIDEKKCCI